MNKIAKIISVVLSVSLVIGVSVAMLVSAFAATAPKFSIDVAEQSDSKVVVSLSLDEGSVTAFDIQVNAKDWSETTKTTGLTLTEIKRSDNIRAYNAAHEDDEVPPVFAIGKEQGKVSFAGLEAYNTVGVMFTFTFSKAKANDVEPSDFLAVVNSCSDESKTPVDASITNKIPASEKPVVTTTTTKPVEDTTTTTAKPVEDTTTTTAKPVEDTTTTTAKPVEDTTTTTAAVADVTTTEAAADVTTTVKAVEDVPAATEDASADESTAPAVDSTVAGSASSDAVANPKTGDRLTATAAVVSLLAISGAAVVALRKKED